MRLLRSFEEIIFEAVTWLIFYPLTLWRIVTRPLSTMRYSDREQTDRDEGRYDDAISPPLLLLFTLVLISFAGLALHVATPEAQSTILHSIVNSPQNLLMFRALVFSLLPLLAAAALLLLKRARLSRESLRPPFYAQCYLAAPVALALSIGGMVLQRTDIDNMWGLVPMLLAAGWFMVTETRWFARELEVTRAQALAITSVVVVISGLYLLVIIVPIALV